MLLSTNISKTPTVERLVNHWSERYTVDLSSLCKSPNFYGELVKAGLPEARALTAAKLLDGKLNSVCLKAGTKGNFLYQYIPDIINSHQVERITQLTYHLYQKLLEIYQQYSGLIVSPVVKKQTTIGVSQEVSLSLMGIPDIEKLLTELEPVLLKYQDEYVMAEDWRTLGFLTTMLNLSNKSLTSLLTPAEKVLLCPYFKFVEEQVAIPWQRVCAAAAKHQIGSPAFTLVEQMFPLASEIAANVYCRLILLFPHHRSKRGELSHPDVAHSCLRDLHMFQAYLWLCVLEESLRPLERELVSLCVMVMPSVGVEWEMTDKWKRLLANEIESRVQPESKPLLLNYTQGMEQVFFKARKQLGHPGDMIRIPSNLEENLTFFNSKNH